MKKCPECGNPSYDGAPVCGNCGYKFPKPKVTVSREESIFQDKPKVKEPSNEESTLSILKEKKLTIGIILIITLIVICGIILTGSNGNNNNSVQTNDFMEYSAGNFAFKYPGNWEKLNLTDEEREGAIFFEDENKTIIEHYNLTREANSIKEISQDRISIELNSGNTIELVETVSVDGRNASNIIVENTDGNYTRYVSMFNDGELYVFKITGASLNATTSDKINAMINSADIA